jgi:hypothetical protein
VAQPVVVVKETVTIASCSVATTTAGVPAQCITPTRHYAYKVFSMQMHVRANPGGQAVDPANLYLNCTGPGSGPSQPLGNEQVNYRFPGATPFDSLTLATPYHRFCTAQASACGDLAGRQTGQDQVAHLRGAAGQVRPGGAGCGRESGRIQAASPAHSGRIHASRGGNEAIAASRIPVQLGQGA